MIILRKLRCYFFIFSVLAKPNFWVYIYLTLYFFWRLTALTLFQCEWTVQEMVAPCASFFLWKNQAISIYIVKYWFINVGLYSNSGLNVPLS